MVTQNFLFPGSKLYLKKSCFSNNINSTGTELDVHSKIYIKLTNLSTATLAIPTTSLLIPICPNCCCEGDVQDGVYLEVGSLCKDHLERSEKHGNMIVKLS